jgi:hypothetical protein
MFIEIATDSDQYFGIVRDDYYSEILKNAPRRSVDSMDLLSKTEIDSFHHQVAQNPGAILGNLLKNHQQWKV